VIAVGLSQVGEFSFILGEGGVSLGLLAQEQYSLILAAALISITLNPFMYKLLPWLEHMLRRAPGLWRKLEANRPLPEVIPETLTDHVVIIGYGRIGRHLVTVLRQLSVPVLVIEMEMEQIDALNAEGIATLYGDAANSEVITHAHLSQARALVVTVPEESATAIIIASARALNPQLPIVARAASEPGVRELAGLGADRIIHPEMEGGLEIVHHTLLLLGYPLREVHAYGEAVRRDQYEWQINSSAEHRSLHDLVTAADSIEISWITLGETSPITGKSLQESDVRAHTGASVVALLRDQHLIANPKSSTEFSAGDRLGLIGDQDQIAAAMEWLGGEEAVQNLASPEIE
jgi:CPA2 family monovalent cation:H+ antiporter-2